MAWFGRVRDIVTKEIYSLYDVDEMFGEENGLIRCWVKKSVKSPDFKEEWIECDLELFTGFYDQEGKQIFEGDRIIYNNNEFEIIFDNFVGQWVVDGDSGRGPVFDIAHQCKVIQMDRS